MYRNVVDAHVNNFDDAFINQVIYDVIRDYINESKENFDIDELDFTWGCWHFDEDKNQPMYHRFDDEDRYEVSEEAIYRLDQINKIKKFAYRIVPGDNPHVETR